MRFKADVSSLLTLSRVCESLTKLTKRAVLKLTPDMVHFIVSSGEDAGGVQVWAQFDKDTLFSGYRVESHADNVIWLEFLVSSFHSAFKSTTGATQVSMRLAKKDKQPILSLSIKNASAKGSAYEIIHDVPVKVIRPADAEAMKEPLCPDPDVHIVLPPLTALLHTTTQMGKISSTIHVSVNRNGHLSLRAESDLANVQTDWRDLEQPDISTHDAAGDDGGDDGAEAEAESQQVDKMAFESVALDQKSFVKFLSSHVIANTTIASICKNFACICYVYIGAGPAGGGVLTYFIPAVNRE